MSADRPEVRPGRAASAPAGGEHRDAGRDSRRRLAALIHKEFRQLLRDRSNLLIGMGLPIVLILIFGYGLSLDVRGTRLVVVLEDSSPVAYEVVANLGGAPDTSVLTVRSFAQARQLMEDHQADAVVRLPADFARRAVGGDARVQLLLQGGDPARAAGVRGYVEGVLATLARKRQDRNGAGIPVGVTVIDRMWFNAANDSTWYLVPGLVVLIMTLVGAFLTALVMAREWERGTLEALFITPVRPAEVLIAKIVPYFCVGMAGMGLCLLAARFLFGVPIQGSLALLLAAGMLYMVVSLGIGLVISALTRNQFLASQVAILASFMPAVMLSGFVFDLRNVPQAVSVIGHLLPATYFMELVKTLFLAGDHWPLVLRDCTILMLFAVGLLGMASAATRKRLD